MGLGASVEKLHYLPEAHTDFLLAVIGEELGFVGVTVVILLFSWLVIRALAVGRKAVTLERPFSAHGIVPLCLVRLAEHSLFDGARFRGASRRPGVAHRAERVPQRT